MMPASSFVGDDLSSRFSECASGLGSRVRLTLDANFSGRSFLFLVVCPDTSIVPSIWMIVHAAYFMTVISCGEEHSRANCVNCSATCAAWK